ncbi:MAG TPA: lipoyl synthase [Bacteroidales bacterium]|nr:lipoyl synthase [Bacteroidales bacterium]HOS57352.1 lipoyl synthase [Bacteroidales bacterium]HRR04743.1 lipoyl synthase [Bacteroidales bacterium]HRT13615.1 lipoyl synthase [Bacteroidales bacterium]HXK73935.1 lipoyl synthase [Bacteroidales bacterium]
MKILRKPDWLKIKLENGKNYPLVKKIVQEQQLHTICTSGKCPNIGQCWSLGTATLMILGDICTRACKFCATKTGKPLPLDEEEPRKIAESIAKMKLKHCVITSVDRDDLPDKGAAHWAKTIVAIREKNPAIIIEVLIPDYEDELLQIVLDAEPDIVAHNLETVKRLTPSIRSRASYNKSMNVLEQIAKKKFIAKTGIMVGLGETQEEVIELLKEVKDAGCLMITIGQYLQPTKQNIEVAEYIHPDIFEFYKQTALKLGFVSVESAPLVRSSYMAERSFLNSLINKK